MKTTRCLGLLGGVGVGAASFYYREIAKAANAHQRELDLVMVHAEVSRVLQYVQADDRQGLERYLNAFLIRMQAAGAAMAVIPSVTTHFCIRELLASSPLPLLVLFDPVAAEIARRSIRRVVVFGTRFVMQSDMYGKLPGLEYIRPRPEELDLIHDTYLRVALDGKGTPAQYSQLHDLATALIKREQLDAIVFGGTDLSLLFDESNTHFPVIDCAALHIEAITRAIL